MKDYFWIIFGKSSSAIAQLLILLVLASRAGAETLSLTLAVFSLSSVIGTLGDLGLGTFAMKEKAYGDEVKAYSAIRLSGYLCLGTAALGLTIMFFLSLQEAKLLATAPLLVWGAVERTTENRLLLLIAEKRIKEAAVITGSRRLLSFTLFTGLLYIVPAGWAFSLSMSASAVLALIYTARRNSRGAKDAELRNFKGLLGASFPFTLTSVAGQLRNLDVTIVTAFVSATMAAAYGFGARIASPVLLVFSAASNLILVRVKNYTPKLAKSLLVILPIIVSVLSILLISASSLIEIVLANYINWIDASTSIVIVLVAASYMFAGVGIVFGAIFIAYGMQKTLVKINLVAAVMVLMGVTGSVVLVGSVTFAALTALAAYCLQVLVQLVVLWGRVGSASADS